MKKLSTVDKTFLNLCEEVDYWQDQAEYWKEKYQEEVRETSRINNERLEDAKKGVGQALMFALTVREGENGDLIIPQEDRILLAQTYKS